MDFWNSVHQKMLPWDRFKSLTQSTILPLRAIGWGKMGQKISSPQKVVPDGGMQ